MTYNFGWAEDGDCGICGLTSGTCMHTAEDEQKARDAARLDALVAERARIEAEILKGGSWEHINDLAAMLGEIDEEEQFLKQGITW